MVENLQQSYDHLRTTLAEDDSLVKQCLERLEKAKKQSNTQAQLVDEKHVTEALIQTNQFLTSTSEAFAKGDKAEHDRLEELKKAVADQEAFIAKRASDCAAFIQHVQSTKAQLEAMKTHLLAKTQPPESQEVQPMVNESVPAVSSGQLSELHKILAAVNLTPEAATKLREDINAVLVPPPAAGTYGKAAVGPTPALQAARVGPYQKEENKAEDLMQVEATK